VNNEEGFYVVWQPGGGNPRMRHDSRAVATQEAERLAAANPGREFFVLEAISVSQSKTVTTERLSTPIPF
jgi:hypothetical protein